MSKINPDAISQIFLRKAKHSNYVFEQRPERKFLGFVISKAEEGFINLYSIFSGLPSLLPKEKVLSNSELFLGEDNEIWEKDSVLIRLNNKTEVEIHFDSFEKMKSWLDKNIPNHINYIEI